MFGVVLNFGVVCLQDDVVVDMVSSSLVAQDLVFSRIFCWGRRWGRRWGVGHSEFSRYVDVYGGVGWI